MPTVLCPWRPKCYKGVWFSFPHSQTSPNPAEKGKLKGSLTASVAHRLPLHTEAQGPRPARQMPAPAPAPCRGCRTPRRHHRPGLPTAQACLSRRRDPPKQSEHAKVRSIPSYPFSPDSSRAADALSIPALSGPATTVSAKATATEVGHPHTRARGAGLTPQVQQVSADAVRGRGGGVRNAPARAPDQAPPRLGLRNVA